MSFSSVASGGGKAAEAGVKVGGAVLRGALYAARIGVNLRQRSFDAKAREEERRQNAKSKNQFRITIKNDTTFTLTSPRVYFKRGYADKCPEFEVESNKITRWPIRSRLFSRKAAVEGMLIYTITPSTSLVIMFSVNCPDERQFFLLRLCECCRRTLPNAFAVEITDRVPNNLEEEAALYKELRMSSDRHNPADDNKYESTLAGSSLMAVAAMRPYSKEITVQIVEEGRRRLESIPERCLSDPGPGGAED